MLTITHFKIKQLESSPMHFSKCICLALQKSVRKARALRKFKVEALSKNCMTNYQSCFISVVERVYLSTQRIKLKCKHLIFCWSRRQLENYSGNGIEKRSFRFLIDYFLIFSQRTLIFHQPVLYLNFIKLKKNCSLKNVVIVLIHTTQQILVTCFIAV